MLAMERRGESIIDRSWEERYDYIKIEVSKIHKFRREDTLG